MSSSSQSLVQHGHSVLVRIAKGDIRHIKAEENGTAVIPKFGSFLCNDLIGQPYGLTYEIVGKNLKLLPPRLLQEVEDTDATNELISDGQLVQPLTLDEIKELKQSGAHSSDIIQKQIENHANFALKTEYSKEKYKKRKEAKYSKTFTTIEPTIFNVCEYWFAKDQTRIRDIRSDSLGQILNLANIHPGGRFLVVEDASGIVASAILKRLGGDGQLLAICDTESPPAFPVMQQLNLTPDEIKPLRSLNWATALQDYNPIVPPSDLAPGEIRSERQKSRLKKQLFAGEFDGLVIATEYDPYSVIERLAPFLGGSALIVVHSPYIQILSDLQAKLRNMPQYLSPSVTEGWLRRYQILPGRTHPMMAMSGSGGFILHALKV
ncbi:Gcd10p family-domain-containing protein [Ephemerocybe angulata]|uniref:tRNA (adenine(58)-N(1))-methyltransferase non-catalytic subunit TRM6 n=1 Tax=Ephemerocybe angulata TaxID=980116 RepID=A0A8H6MFB9_9AGAR|nr:Gcd10p family-domain-containing protein [Tulosesus angulatus]